MAELDFITTKNIMPKFSERSLKNLAEVHVSLQKIFSEVIKRIDCVILWGYRGKEDQEKAFSEGDSELHYPHSKHNKIPSLAVDCAPYPIDWNDFASFKELGKIVLEEAKNLNIKIRWGAEWGDYPHYELIL